MFTEKQKNVIDSALLAESREKKVRGLAKWFEIDLEIKIFGMTIVKWHFPPENENSSPYSEIDEDC